MTVDHRPPDSDTMTPVAPCRDYDPNFRLHGCELPAHDPAMPHRDCLGNEWIEHLPDEPWRCEANWGSGYRSQQCLIPEGHRGLHLDEHGNRWGEAARVQLVLAAARTTADAEAVLWGMSRDDLLVVAAGLGVTVNRGEGKETIRRGIAEAREECAGAAPAPNGPDGFTCDCGTRLAWPSKAEDVTCPSCGTVWEHDGVDLGGGARIKQQPSCSYCHRTGRQLAPCCELPDHQGQDHMVCADVVDCRDFLLAQLQEQDERFDAAEARFGAALQEPDTGAVSTALTERLELLGSMEAEDVRTALAFIAR